MTHKDYCQQFLSQDGWLLDVGSGRGKFVCEMAKCNSHIFGIETNEEYIKETLIRAKQENVDVHVICGQAENLPFSDNQFDFVNATEVTEHVNEPRRMIHEIYRVLKHEGKCYISFHNRFGMYDYHYHLPLINFLPRSWTEPIFKFLHRQKPDGQNIGRQKLTTMHYFTFKKLNHLLKSAGFEVHDIRADKIKKIYGTISPLASLVYKMLRPFYFNTFHILLEKK